MGEFRRQAVDLEGAEERDDGVRDALRDLSDRVKLRGGCVDEAVEATIHLLQDPSLGEPGEVAPGDPWILLDRKARIPKLAQPKLEIVRASGAALESGIETRIIEGIPVRLTTPAKTVADCFRYRRHVGLEVALAAMREYLRRPAGGRGRRPERSGASRIDELVVAAHADRIYSVLRPYLEALA